MTVCSRAWLALALCVPAIGNAQLDGSDHVKVRVDGPLGGISKEGTLRVALTFVLEQDWHIYWKNPGDSGAPPTLKWTLPEGYRVVETRWPAPHRIVSGGIVSYGFEGTPAFIVEIQTGPTHKAGDTFPFTLETDYLVCKDLCLQGTGKVSGEIRSRADDGSSISPKVPTRGSFETTSFRIVGDTVELTFDVPKLAGTTAISAYFFSSSETALDHAADQKWRQEGSKLILTTKKSEYAKKAFDGIDGVLAIALTSAQVADPIRLEIEYTKPKTQENK